MPKWVDVCPPGEIANDKCKIIEVDKIPIAVFNINGEFFAIKDNCPHEDLPLADGLVENCDILCPFHGASFDLATGKVLVLPNDEPCDGLTVYNTRVLDDKIQVEV